jgi:hypothetical protein
MFMVGVNVFRGLMSCRFSHWGCDMKQPSPMRWLVLLAFAALPVAAAANFDPGMPGQDNIIVGGDFKTTFLCQSSATGHCHNALFRPNGVLFEHFTLNVGERRVFIDLPDDTMVCLADAKIADTAGCAKQRIHAMLK